MNKKYDVIVVGGGISGTIVSAYLAKGGLKVALFEATDQIGGPLWGAYTKPGGYKTERTSHLPSWYAFSNGGGGYWAKAAAEVGANLQFVVMPNNAVWAPWMKTPAILPICTTGQAYVDFFQQLSPVPLPDSTKKGLIALFENMHKMTEEEMWGEKADTTPAKEWVESATQDEGAIFAMARAAGFVGAEKEKALESVSKSLLAGAAFGIYAGSFFLLAMQGGNTSCVIPQEFARAAQRYGADVFVSHPVKQVVVNGKKATGVVVSTPKGEVTVEADKVVISTMWSSYRSLLGSHVPTGYEATLKEYERTRRIDMDIHYGLKEDIVKYPNWANVMLLDENMQYDFMIAVPSFYNNAFAPQGKQLIQIEMYRSLEDFNSKTKEEWVKHIEDRCEQLYPGWLAAVEWREVILQTPILNHGYLPIKKFPHQHSDIKNIYFTGDSTQGPYMVTDKAACTAMKVKDLILEKR